MRSVVMIGAFVAVAAPVFGDADPVTKKDQEKGKERDKAGSRDDGGWKPLFDGKTLSGWTTLSGKPVEGWVAEDGCLRRKERKGDIYSEGEFSDFVLELEFNIAPGGNSGVKYRMKWYGDSYLGPEYQILDDHATKPGKDPKTGKVHWGTGTLYVIDPGTWEVDPRRPAGQWNQARIVCDGSKIEHWLNGHLIVKADTTSEAFKDGVARSKFSGLEDYGCNPSGRIMLQEHGSGVRFRNIRLRELKR